MIAFALLSLYVGIMRLRMRRLERRLERFEEGDQGQ